MDPGPCGARGDLYLEVPVSLDTPRGKARELEMVAFVVRSDGEEVRSARLHVGYKLLPQAWFRPDEIFRGRHAFPLPADLEPGTYDLGLIVRTADGEVLAPQIPQPAHAPVRSKDELWFPGAVEVVGSQAFDAVISEARSAVQAAAEAQRCSDAEAAWVRLKRHRARNWAWHEAEEAQAGAWLADCWAREAENEPDRAVDHLARAHRWDHHSAELERVGRPLAEAWLAEAQAARQSGDWERAYRRFADVLRFEPWRAWARRWAEEARDHRLGLVGDERFGIGGDDNLRTARGE